MTEPRIENEDLAVLRDLAGQVARIAALPVMRERRELWKRHNALQPTRPMMLVFPEGAWCELLPQAALRCGSEFARGVEAALRRRIYTYEHFHDDTVAEADWVVHKVIRNTGWGLEPQWQPSSQQRGAKGYQPVLLTAADLDRLQMPQISCDHEATQRKLDVAMEIFDGILAVRLRGPAHLHFHVMPMYFSLRGMTQAMLDMVENPAMVHDFAGRYRDGILGLIRQYQEQDLLSLNNDGTYHSSGGVGYTDELPACDFDGRHVRPCDVWASAEDQELAQVSPEMHAEFALTYVKDLLSPFGLSGYGCCEDLTRKLDYVFELPALRRISISPWADVDTCAEKLTDRYIFSWKPHPAHLVGDFNADEIRRYVRHTLDAARGCVLEIILKDTHTCEHHPERFGDWIRIAREEIDTVVGRST